MRQHHIHTMITFDAQNEADVAIDFSNPNLLFPLLEEEFQLPLVIATTGEKEKLIEKLNELSHNMPVFFSANMSYGVHALTKILEASHFCKIMISS